MREELNKLLEDFDESYGSFQLSRLIVAKAGGTRYGMYQQALRELNGRLEGLKDLFIEKEYLQIDMCECVEKRSNPKTNKYEVERAALKIKKCTLRLDTLERKIDRRIKEIKRLYGIAVSLKREVGDLSPERRDYLETQAHNHYIKRKAVMELELTGRLGHGSAETIYALAPSDRFKLISELKLQSYRKNFLEEGVEDLPLPSETITTEDVKRLAE